MEEESVYYGSQDAVELKYGYYMFFFSLTLFHLLNWLMVKMGTPRLDPNCEDSWRYRNLFISWIHGALAGTWTISCYVFYPELLDDPITFINYYTYLLIPFCTGYFVYDFIDLGKHNRLLKNWEVTCHHIAVTSMFWYDFHQRICIGYNVIALLAEVNSFFLHSRKLLQMNSVAFNNLFYRCVTISNLVTFALCRGFGLGRITYGMLTEGHRVPAVYYYVLTGSMFVMNGMNPVLFWRLFKNDVLRWNDTKKPEKVHINGNNNIARLKVK